MQNKEYLKIGLEWYLMLLLMTHVCIRFDTGVAPYYNICTQDYILSIILNLEIAYDKQYHNTTRKI